MHDQCCCLIEDGQDQEELYDAELKFTTQKDSASAWWLDDDENDF